MKKIAIFLLICIVVLSVGCHSQKIIVDIHSFTDKGLIAAHDKGYGSSVMLSKEIENFTTNVEYTYFDENFIGILFSISGKNLENYNFEYSVHYKGEELIGSGQRIMDEEQIVMLYRLHVPNSMSDISEIDLNIFSSRLTFHYELLLDRTKEKEQTQSYFFVNSQEIEDIGVVLKSYIKTPTGIVITSESESDTKIKLIDKDMNTIDTSSKIHVNNQTKYYFVVDEEDIESVEVSSKGNVIISDISEISGKE